MKLKPSLCLSLTLLLNCFFATSQTLPTITSPNIITIENQINDTIYMAVNGDDNNAGTSSQPVKSFIKALQLLPFGTQGVNNGNAYGLVILKEGHYLTDNGFSQPESQWKNGNTYKNVSVKGEGNELHAQNLSMALYDVNGKAFEAEYTSVSENELKINTSNLAKGIYFIKATHQHKQFYGRFVVGE